MKISELIEKLNEIKNQYGDIEPTVRGITDDSTYEWFVVEKVDVKETHHYETGKLIHYVTLV